MRLWCLLVDMFWHPSHQNWDRSWRKHSELHLEMGNNDSNVDDDMENYNTNDNNADVENNNDNYHEYTNDGDDL